MVSQPWNPYSDDPPCQGVHHIGAATKSRYPQAARTRPPVPSRASTTRAGMIHTQWCVQEIGETRSPVTPVTAAAPSQSSSLTSAAATVRPRTPIVSGTSGYQTPACVPCPKIRSAAP
jgi:hypothetical protein